MNDKDRKFSWPWIGEVFGYADLRAVLEAAGNDIWRSMRGVRATDFEDATDSDFLPSTERKLS